MAENKSLWNWGNQQKYHDLLELDLDNKLGSLSDLATTDKSSLVNAINEVKSNFNSVTNKLNSGLGLSVTETVLFDGTTDDYYSATLTESIYNYDLIKIFQKSTDYSEFFITPITWFPNTRPEGSSGSVNFYFDNVYELLPDFNDSPEIRFHSAVKVYWSPYSNSINLSFTHSGDYTYNVHNMSVYGYKLKVVNS